jgi:integrase
LHPTKSGPFAAHFYDNYHHVLCRAGYTGEQEHRPDRFCTREGTPYDNRDIVGQVLHPILERLGIARAGWHAFRHGNATIMDGLNAPMRVRQDRLGHEKAETTLGYTHAIGREDRRIADEIGVILCPSLPKSPAVEAPKQLPVQ